MISYCGSWLGHRPTRFELVQRKRRKRRRGGERPKWWIAWLPIRGQTDDFSRRSSTHFILLNQMIFRIRLTFELDIWNVWTTFASDFGHCYLGKHDVVQTTSGVWFPFVSRMPSKLERFSKSPKTTYPEAWIFLFQSKAIQTMFGSRFCRLQEKGTDVLRGL